MAVAATVENQKTWFPDLYCEDCLQDPEIKCPRDRDVKCLHCGRELCGYHMVKHIKGHCVSVEWKGIQ